MKKNNKGFTLIELLAVIVIMGILAIMVIPRISDLVMETREEIYLQDAKKLMAQAQYRMSSNNVEIEKPEMDECIVFSLKYLSSNDFRNPPNDGSYMGESSFVVVRNVDGNFEYAVLLIESRKDGLYQGVEFVTEKQLNARDAIKHVRFFDEEELRYIDVNAGENNKGDAVDTHYINQQLSKSGLGSTSWVENDSIIGTYNDIKMKEGAVADASSPKFTAKINSNGVTDEIGTLTATLTVSAVDTDDSLDTLKVCVKVRKNETDLSEPDSCESYGEKNYYSKELNFSLYGFTHEEGQIAYVYITVIDPSGNKTEKIVEHTIHQNVGPVISKMELTRRNGDQVNMPTALLTVDVNDDLDKLDDLRVCFQQDSTDIERCYGDYQSYYSYFDHNNHYFYTFRDDNNKPITNPDGSSHNLLMFVKDKEDKVSVASAKYQIFKNEDPTINLANIYSCNTIKGFNSLNYFVDLNISDDFNEGKLMVKIGDEAPMKYTDYLVKQAQTRQCSRAPGFYDGKDREIVVKVWDEFQTEDDAIFTSVFLRNVYLNEVPYINSIKINGKGKLCLDSRKTICTTDGNTEETGGTYSTQVTIDAADDLLTDSSDFVRKIFICINEDPSYCAEDQVDHFVAYKNKLDYTFTVPSNSSDIYAIDDVRNLYVAFREMESYKDETIYQHGILGPYQYKIYKNQAPYFTSSNYTITTAAPYNVANFKEVLTNFTNVKVHDDFDQYTMSFCYFIDGGEEVCTESLPKSQFNSLYGSHFTFKNSDGSDISFYEGQVIDTHLVVTDQFGLSGESGHFVYKLHTDEAPEIKSASIRSNSSAYNTNFIYVTLSVVDVGDTYTVCIKEDGKGECSDSDFRGKSNGEPFSGDYNGRNPSTATLTFDGVNLAGWSSTYSEENPNKLLRIFVKDSRGNVVEYGQKIPYELYVSCVNNLKTLRTEYSLKDGENDLDMNYCNGLCYHNSPNENLFPTNTVSSVFDKLTYNKDNLISYECPVVREEENKYCNYSSCFEHTNNKEPYFIGLTLLSPKLVWTDTPAGETMEQAIEKPYCDQLITKNEIIFNSRDSRCNDSSYCEDYAEIVCMDQSNYDECMNTYRNKCSTALGKFCNKGLDESMHEINCSEYDSSNSNHVKRLCRKDFLNGICYENDNSCSGNNDPNCWNKCYEKMNCAPETQTVQAVVTCHGYYQQYKRVYRNYRMALANTGVKICPEVFEKYPNHYKFDSNAAKPYVLFNEEEQLSIVDLTGGGDDNG